MNLKKDLILSAIAGKMGALFLIFLIQNPKIEEFKIFAFLGKKIYFLLILLPFFFSFSIFIWHIFIKNKSLGQFLKYLQIGLLNTFVDLGTLTFLMSITHLTSGFFYSLFKGASFFLANTNSYFWNKLWTFQKKGFKNLFQEYPQFLGISAGGLILNVLIASFLVNVIAPPKISPYFWGMISAFFAAIFTILWNFLGYKFFVFKS